WNMLWCYVAEDGGGLACFPLIRGSDPNAPARAAMAVPLGSRVSVRMRADKRGRLRCESLAEGKAPRDA
ncbi:MAG: hypothetical protein IJ087_07885, partial [Eggerthellaceae bacterium]|nr:hypothetical protein [Eggerthellaceae bacterium]